jgi:hypothetical protein
MIRSGQVRSDFALTVGVVRYSVQSRENTVGAVACIASCIESLRTAPAMA